MHVKRAYVEMNQKEIPLFDSSFDWKRWQMSFSKLFEFYFRVVRGTEFGKSR